MKNINHAKHIIITILAITCSLPLLAKDIPIEINSDSETHFKNGIAYACGNAQFKYQGVMIKADQIEYNQKTGEIRLLQKNKNGKAMKLVATLVLNKEK